MTFTNGVLRLPAGTTYLDEPLVLPPGPCSVIGEGHGVSRLVARHPSANIRGRFESFDFKLLRDFSLSTTVDAQVPAIDLAWPAAESINEQMFQLQGIRVAPEPSHGLKAWRAGGIRINHGWNGRIVDCNLHGYNGDNDGMLFGIQLDGRSMDVSIRGTQMYGCSTGIDILGDCEGPLIHHCLMMSSKIGLHSHTTVERPWLALSDSHIAARKYGVLLEWRPQASITGNLIYRGPTSEPGFVGIYLSASHDARVTGNEVFVLGDVRNQTNYGVVTTAPTGTITGNVFRGASVPIWATAPGAIVAPNYTAVKQ